ncbi:MAG: hypothetical protein BVN33_17155 [Proteobacteria bacterium ST_bin13]|nr:MAG: hypothetical protein BVN33_17155 [Proteobacteria bacterium ST_bin13]
MGKLSKIGAWCWGNYDKVIQVGTVVVAFAVPAWATFVSPFMAPYAPLSWVAAGFAGSLVASVILYVLAVSYSKFVTGKRTAEILQRTALNPLETHFVKAVIRLSDFYDPNYIGHRNKDFRDCSVVGPGLVLVTGGQLENVTFKFTQIVILADSVKSAFGLTAFQDCKFVGGIFSNCTLLMTQKHYDQLPATVRANIPVIS